MAITDNFWRGLSQLLLEVETVIEFWSRPDAFDRMPTPIKDFLIERTEANVRGIESNFSEVYSPELLR